ncbi:hypothetical protein DNTS_014886 [Danionella cerebrum]|uniref:Uncharacterized protein n=1 Tax=Danionella cerebrum TaxID=2873325 RepID=A0A553RCC4_9TELE|nr:hypothetical protein DNTS_014886 [Danionella translucida]
MINLGEGWIGDDPSGNQESGKCQCLFWQKDYPSAKMERWIQYSTRQIKIMIHNHTQWIALSKKKIRPRSAGLREQYCTCMKTFIRSRGAVPVRETAPAMPPAKSCFHQMPVVFSSSVNSSGMQSHGEPQLASSFDAKLSSRDPLCPSSLSFQQHIQG